tara:strand:+ start:101 stop:277 length:177 start_codon:yes stop_codon:yes gene_type:complete
VNLVLIQILEVALYLKIFLMDPPKKQTVITHENTMFDGKNFGLLKCLKNRNKLLNMVG